MTLEILGAVDEGNKNNKIESCFLLNRSEPFSPFVNTFTIFLIKREQFNIQHFPDSDDVLHKSID